MRLNPDCIRDILLQAELNPFRIESSDKFEDLPFKDLNFYFLILTMKLLITWNNVI